MDRARSSDVRVPVAAVDAANEASITFHEPSAPCGGRPLRLLAFPLRVQRVGNMQTAALGGIAERSISAAQHGGVDGERGCEMNRVVAP